MPRRTFFSFHYIPDVWRAWNVRNSWVVRDSEQISVGFFDGSAAESMKKEDELLKDFLHDQLRNTSVTCVLSGSGTWARRWVRYEIARSVTRGNGLLNLHIDGVQNSDKQISSRGPNPLDFVGLYRSGGSTYLAEKNNGRWERYEDYTKAIPDGDLWFSPPSGSDVTPISRHCMSYDFSTQNGRSNIGSWIEAAAGQAGKN